MKSTARTAEEDVIRELISKLKDGDTGALEPLLDMDEERNYKILEFILTRRGHSRDSVDINQLRRDLRKDLLKRISANIFGGSDPEALSALLDNLQHNLLLDRQTMDDDAKQGDKESRDVA